jgi:hypothetical protein
MLEVGAVPADIGALRGDGPSEALIGEIAEGEIRHDILREAVAQLGLEGPAGILGNVREAVAIDIEPRLRIAARERRDADIAEALAVVAREIEPLL